ncbi:hypothetical protein Tco_0866163 [Tanacetum coccineum]
MGGSLSQPRTDPTISPINAFLIADLYTPEFSESLQENTGYWQELNPHEAMGEQVATSPTKKKNKPTRNRQKRTIQTDNAPRQIAWTTKKEIVLANGWVVVSENSKHGNARKKDGFWCEVLEYMESKKKVGCRTYDMVVERWKTVRPAVVRFCGVYGNIMRMAQESGAGYEDYMRCKARATAKNKGSKASGSSTMNDDALARLMVTETITQEKAERLAFIEIKMREVECHKQEVATQEYRAQQEDIRFYLQPYDHLTGDQRLAMDEARAKITTKYNLQY